MRRTFVVVDEQDEYGEIILSLAALEVRASHSVTGASTH
jgi:hypothetical protein